MAKNTDKKLFVAYSDSMAGEVGTIYSSCGFDYLGQNYGTKYLLSHPAFKNKVPFSPQSLRRTALLKKWHKEEFGTSLPIEVINPKSGFKDMKKMAALHPDLRNWFYNKCRTIESESVKIPVPSKGKWALVLGKDKREQRILNSMKNYVPKPKPRRDDPKMIEILRKNIQNFNSIGAEDAE
jgi:hypothetical protein